MALNCKTILLSLGLTLGLASAGHALTQKGDPVDIGLESMPFFVPFEAELGDLHWSYAEATLDWFNAGRSEANRATVENVMAVVVKASGGYENFGEDSRGYPTFIAGKTYLLPVNPETLESVASGELTMADLQTQVDQALADVSGNLTAFATQFDGALGVFRDEMLALQSRVSDNERSVDMLGEWVDETNLLAEDAANDASMALTAASDAAEMAQGAADSAAANETQIGELAGRLDQFDARLGGVESTNFGLSFTALGLPVVDQWLPAQLRPFGPLLTGLLIFIGVLALVLSLLGKRRDRKIERKLKAVEGEVRHEETGLAKAHENAGTAHTVAENALQKLAPLKARVEDLERTQAVLVQRDADRLYSADFTEEGLNGLQDREALELEIEDAGAARRKVRLVMHRPETDTAYIELFGIDESSGFSRIDARKDGRFSTVQIYRTIARAIDNNAVIGLGKPLAVA